MGSTHESPGADLPREASISSGLSERVEFEAFVGRVQKRVYALLLRRVGDRETAKDLTQDTFLKAWQKWHTFVQRQRDLPWIFTIARNNAADHFRRSNTEKRGGERQHPDGDRCEPVDHRGGTPLEQLIIAEKRAAVWSAIGQLPERQQKIIIMRCAGLSYAEIAKETGRSKSAIGTTLVHIRKKLRKMVSGDAACA